MTFRQTILIFLLAFFFLLGTIQLVRHHMFREKYSLLWIGISLLFLSIPFLERFYNFVGELLGINNFTSFLLLCALLTQFLLSVQFTVALSVAFHQRKEMAQQMAMLEAKVRGLEKQAGQPETASDRILTHKHQDAKDIQEHGQVVGDPEV
ncbi:MAG: DUF2304 domain-containing protein [Magnetococcales bacterium]|nr:DUF2304 domain-containing protein [Magnetococcales bacterium]MBF0116789.1 DUF2304 domain-containing protein [Magnetococcales bacterium]